jgi:predicted  nucleic acid-binding Zn-ribbon protein
MENTKTDVKNSIENNEININKFKEKLKTEVEDFNEKTNSTVKWGSLITISVMTLTIAGLILGLFYHFYNKVDSIRDKIESISGTASGTAMNIKFDEYEKTIKNINDKIENLENQLSASKLNKNELQDQDKTNN